MSDRPRPGDCTSRPDPVDLPPEFLDALIPRSVLDAFSAEVALPFEPAPGEASPLMDLFLEETAEEDL